MTLNKRKKAQIDQFLADIFDIQDAQMVVVRRKDCSVLYSNNPAIQQVNAAGGSTAACKQGYSKLFPRLCEVCPAQDVKLDAPLSIELEDVEGRTYSAKISTVEWLDEKPATAFFIRDITEEKSIQERLYNLAYMDHLTGVPNRRKFREDFDAIEAEISGGKKCGVVCIFDMDNFKGINDTYGHNTGDVMLRRLTEHLRADPAFDGHIYRLGGDEFVLLFSMPSDRFESEGQLRQYYDALLEGALVTYTMPNIELSCTISMGVAFFPSQGETASDLLRKADIALYQAKAEGRNRKVFFEDKFDTAKKFKDVYINMQPILDAEGKTLAHDLLDCGNDDSGNGQVISLDGFDRTLDALSLSEIESDTRYFITYSSHLLNPAVLNNLPREKFIVQISLPAQVEDKELSIYRELQANGYALAYTGLSPTNMRPDVLAPANYLKMPPAMITGAALRKLMEIYPEKTFIATGVDTTSQYDLARQMGFHLFQGFFFSQTGPVTKKTKEMDPLQVNYFRLLQLTSTENYVDFKVISNIISSDVALSYKLLRLLNSAAVGLRNVSSIAMALAYLGEENLKKWIALLALRGIADGKPLELVRMSLIRARFGELLAPHFRLRRDPKHIFLLGLLSLLHIALEQSREEMLEDIPVAEDIRQSLLTKTGIYSDLLGFFSHYEYASWDEVTRYAEEHRLEPKLINDCYIQAVKWANDLISAQT